MEGGWGGSNSSSFFQEAGESEISFSSSGIPTYAKRNP